MHFSASGSMDRSNSLISLWTELSTAVWDIIETVACSTTPCSYVRLVWRCTTPDDDSKPRDSRGLRVPADTTTLTTGMHVVLRGTCTRAEDNKSMKEETEPQPTNRMEIRQDNENVKIMLIDMLSIVTLGLLTLSKPSGCGTPHWTYCISKASKNSHSITHYCAISFASHVPQLCLIRCQIKW